jgi:hypothetical protein
MVTMFDLFVGLQTCVPRYNTDFGHNKRIQNEELGEAAELHCEFDCDPIIRNSYVMKH